MKNDAWVIWACMNEKKKNSEPCAIQSYDLCISGPKNIHCANKATDVIVGETKQVMNFICITQAWIKCGSEEQQSQEMTRKNEEIITLM